MSIAMKNTSGKPAMSKAPHLAPLTCGLGAVSVLLALFAAPASAADSAEMTATVSVLPAMNCAVEVTPPDDSTFNASWRSGSIPQITSGSTTPRNLMVKVKGDAGCSLNALRMTTTMTGGDHPPGGSGDYSYRVPLTPSAGGYWRFMPYLARAQFYTDDSATQEGTGKITYHSPNSSNVVFQDSPKYTGGQTEYLEVMGEDPGEVANSLFMTDEYAADGGALLVDGTSNIGTFSSDNTAEVYKSATLGLGVLIATGPENATGERDNAVAAEGDKATMTWTITMSVA